MNKIRLERVANATMTRAAVAKLMAIHREAKDGQRLGQRFCNMFIQQPWPDLFYQENENEALVLIQAWLVDHNYMDTLPVQLKKA